MATARRLLVDPGTSGVFHCVSRCVRRAFLCGRDEYSRRDFEHRRGWIRDRLKALGSHFAIEVYSYAVMSNHFHVVLRTDPELMAGLPDAEVARRWLLLFPGPGGKRGQPPEEVAVETLCHDPQKLALCRGRLADVSWFMRCLNEPIARRANHEDECTGRFWEGRFKCQKLEVRPILERLDLNVEAWVDNVQSYGSLFHRLIGKLDRLRAIARSLRRSWLQGHAGARRLYTQNA